MSNTAKWSLGAILLVLLWIGGVFFNLFGASAERAEARLQAAASTAVASLGDDARADLALSVTLDGQDAVLSGVVPSEALRDDAVTAIKQAQSLLGLGAGGALWGGVRSVDASAVTIKPPRTTPYVWRAARDGAQVRLSGLMPDQAKRDLVLARARAVFGDGVNIIDAMTLDEEAPHAHWSDLASVGVDVLGALDIGEAELSTVKLRVRGEALNAAASDAAHQAARAGDRVFRADDDRLSEVLLDLEVRPEPEPVAEVVEETALSESSSEPDPAPPLPDPITIGEAAPADLTEAAPALLDEPALNCQAAFNEALASQTVRFESDSDALRPGSLPLLERLAEIAALCPEARLRIEGHTDSTGDAALNQDLSTRRARSVVTYLAERGVLEERLEAVGFGADRPIADNETPEGRARNRRINITVSG